MNEMSGWNYLLWTVLSLLVANLLQAIAFAIWDLGKRKSLRQALETFGRAFISPLGWLRFRRAHDISTPTIESVENLEMFVDAVSMLDHKHPYYHLIYEISEDNKDWFIYDMSVKALDRKIIAESMYFGAQGEEVGQIRDFREFRMYAWTNKGRTYIQPLSRRLPLEKARTPVWPICVFFSEPISSGEVRQLTVSGIWHDLWNPLRKKGKDSGTWHLDHFTEKLQITVVFPRGITEAELSIHQFPESDNTAVHVEEDLDTKKRLQKKLIIERAEPGDYVYHVTCTQLPGLLEQRAKSFLRR